MGSHVLKEAMMHTATLATPEHSLVATSSPRAVWSGRVLSALPLTFLTFDTVIKLLLLPVAVEATTELGFSGRAVFAIGAIEAVCLVLYLLPRTSVLGAVLWTGYFGGAIATHIGAGSPPFTHTLFPVYVAALLWIGLWLRDARLRRIVRMAFGQ
jgi:hypothetical protein